MYIEELILTFLFIQIDSFRNNENGTSTSSMNRINSTKKQNIKLLYYPSSKVNLYLV